MAQENVSQTHEIDTGAGAGHETNTGAGAGAGHETDETEMFAGAGRKIPTETEVKTTVKDIRESGGAEVEIAAHLMGGQDTVAPTGAVNTPKTRGRVTGVTTRLGHVKRKICPRTEVRDVPMNEVTVSLPGTGGVVPGTGAIPEVDTLA